MSSSGEVLTMDSSKTTKCTVTQRKRFSYTLPYVGTVFKEGCIALCNISHRQFVQSRKEVALDDITTRTTSWSQQKLVKARDIKKGHILSEETQSERRRNERIRCVSRQS